MITLQKVDIRVACEFLTVVNMLW